jgi:hypothetical protein
MRSAGENGARYLAVEWRKKGQVPFFELELTLATAQLNAVGGFDLVACGGIDLNAIEGCEEFPGCARRELLCANGYGG